jgi:signal transduction histidine kinase
VNLIAARLVLRLIVIQFLVGVSALLLAAVFAPPLLLLDRPVILASFHVALTCTVLLTAFAVASTMAMTRRLRPLLRALTEGSSATPPVDLLALYALPARVALADVLAAFAVAVATISPPLRPSENDLATQGSLILLVMTSVSAAALPMYVMMRTQVARVLELAPIAASLEALALMGERGLSDRGLNDRRRPFALVRRRFVAAVAAPVAFVALGAALLVHAHVRVFDTAAREDDAAKVAAAALDAVGTSGGTGRAAATQAAMAHGLAVTVEPSTAPFRVVHDDLGETEVTVPLEDGHAAVRFSTARMESALWLYVVLATTATFLAALLGSRIGLWFAADVALATRAVRETGAADVVRGTRVRREARFGSVVALMDAIDALGNVFRQFASAQEASIEASAATERMRGLFLASMSHDLKGPLNSILGFAQLVSQSPLTAGQAESLSIIEQRGRELLVLIQTILDSARVEARALRVTPDWTMIGDLVMSAVLEARELAVGGSVEVVGEIQPGVPKLFVDSSRIVQALTAIVSSAVRFTEKGVVRVRATLPAGSESLRIDVEAEGRTAPSAEREKIFEAFKDADQARRHGSLGLGLSLARSILQIHGGTIEANMTPDGGCVFQVHLPISGDRIARAISIASELAPEPSQTFGLPRYLDRA